MRRRNFIKTAAAVSLATALPNLKAQEVPTHNWDKYNFGSGPTVSDRLNQGPFGIEQDQGWYTVLVTSQSTKPVKNYGLGLVGYTWEEGGPSLAARAGTETLEKWMLHAVDLGANYWSLWTESDNLRRYYERYPNGFDTLQRRLGYRVRPAWIWQRKRYGTDEVIVAISNDGVAGVPGVLRLYVESDDSKIKLGGALDAGHPYGGKIRQASFVLPKDSDGMKLKIRAEIETKGGNRRPVNWAAQQPANADGSISFQLLRRDDPKWRKGV